VALPPLDREFAALVQWRVSAGYGTVERPGRALGADRVPLGPAGWWRIEATRGGAPALNVMIECFGGSAMVAFDGMAGAYLPDTAGLAAEDAWIVTPPGVELMAPVGDGLAPLPAQEHGASLHGAWAGHRSTRHDLRGIEAVVLVRDGKKQERIAVTQGTRPHIKGTPVRDVTGLAGGEDVHAEAPDLYLPAWGPWSVSLASMRAITAALDPLGILNPGKIFA